MSAETTDDDLPCKGDSLPPVCPRCGATEDDGCLVDRPRYAVLALMRRLAELEREVDAAAELERLRVREHHLEHENGELTSIIIWCARRLPPVLKASLDKMTRGRGFEVSMNG